VTTAPVATTAGLCVLVSRRPYDIERKGPARIARSFVIEFFIRCSSYTCPRSLVTQVASECRQLRRDCHDRIVRKRVEARTIASAKTEIKIKAPKRYKNTKGGEETNFDAKRRRQNNIRTKESVANYRRMNSESDFVVRGGDGYWVMCGRRPRVKGFFGCQLAVGCKSCVRPVCAALIAAGHDVIRRSGPYH
jgi:hypothetical protein